MDNKSLQNVTLLGLIGHPVKNSLSPFIHNVASELLAQNTLYLPFDIPASHLRDAIKGMVALGFHGFNVTLPHKESIIPELHGMSEEASVIGAVNTVVNDMGRLVGYNTDAFGVYDTLEPYKNEISGLEATIIGSGGASRAALYTLIRHFKPSQINIINRTVERADTVMKFFGEKMKYDKIEIYDFAPPDLLSVLNNSKVVINSTPIGTFPDIDDTPIENGKAFVKQQIVFDMVYKPSVTKLQKLAAASGAICINGLNMLIAQAAKSYQLWTGVEMPILKVKKAVEHFIAQ